MGQYEFDLFVIGAGSGGVRASRVAAAHGARVAIAEEHRIGGTCVIRGCVPKKMLVHGSQFSEELRDAAKYGWTLGSAQFEWATLRDNVMREVGRLELLYTDTLRRNNVEVFAERATVSGPHEVLLAGGRRCSAKTILIATGARPAVPTFPGSELGVTSNEIFSLAALPERVVVTGAGYIANEFAGIFLGLGSKVTVIHRSSQILRGYDQQIRDRLFEILSGKGIDFALSARVTDIELREDNSLSVHVEGRAPVDADLVLHAIGRLPNTTGLGLQAVDVEVDDLGAVRVDSDSQTTVPSIFAIGDVTNRMQLTPVAIREGQAFADRQFGGASHRVDYENVPSAVFTNPPLASVGLTEEQARERFGTVKTFTSDFRPTRNVLAGRSERALYKLVVNAESDIVLGIHMVGPDAPEILQAAAIAVKAGLTKAQFDSTVALHPSMAEELVLMR
ncbi:glutathione-disulfide reductase [Variovorax paradoxus]|uniref:glutathione-disulfide reductase n=1 Tax=Variovorax paradoxus TaxID=34073 RepID=UPI00078053F1|nr:glutathione-disulfide reductase [Variovorax paradoxus]